MTTDVTKTNREISDLSPLAQTALKLLIQECLKAGVGDVFVTETYRSQARQNYLYAQGRTRKGSVVTWTKSSIHTQKRAWDLAVCPPKSLYDVNVLSKVGAIAAKLNIEWGGSWKKNVDRPHFQIDANWKIPNGYSLKGDVLVSTSSKTPNKLIPFKTSNPQKEKVNKEMANKEIDFLNKTGRDSFKELILAGVEEGLFTSKHEKVDSYSDKELISYGAAYVARKLKKIK